MSDMIASSVLNGWSAIGVAECLHNLPMALEERLYLLDHNLDWVEMLDSWDIDYLEGRIRQYNEESNYGHF